MEIHYFGAMNAKRVLIQMVDDHNFLLFGQELSHISFLTKNIDFLMAAVKADNWNNDLSPWSAPPVFGTEGFSGGAEKTLQYLISEVMDPLVKTDSERKFYIGGYSLAGLFALWAVYQTDYFKAAAAVSPSVWFPGFKEFIMKNTLNTSSVYLSLGDREEKTRNTVMAQVGDSIRSIYKYLRDRDVHCVLEWNHGNHFKEPDLRMAKGFSWVLSNSERQIPTDENSKGFKSSGNSKDDDAKGV